MQTAQDFSKGDALPVSLYLPSDIAVLAAVVRLDCETTVSPQLALGTETVGCLQQGNQQGGTNRTDRRNLPQHFHGIMFAALSQQIASRFLAHRLEWSPMCAAAGPQRWSPGAACWREAFAIHWWDATCCSGVSWGRFRSLFEE